MCGIAGIYNLGNEEIETRNIEILTHSLQHRGPDSFGIWFNEAKSIAFGHRRLSILDLSDAGAQPMHYLNDCFTIVLNGEIYNFLEIRDELKKNGYTFSSDSDTEVVLAAYHKWGEEMLDRFNGMWAFALYDSLKGNLLLSRDRYGVKPLYYFIDSKVCVFASEVQAIHRYLGSDKALLDVGTIDSISRGMFDYHGSDKTYLKDVKSLKGGYNIVIDSDKNMIIKKWYNLHKKDVPKSFTDQAKELRRLVTEACNIRLRSDVPIGTCLSGGVDSGSITAIINKNKPEDARFSTNNTHKSFCVSFPGSPIDERIAAEKLAAEINAVLDVISVEAPSVEELELAMLSCDGPMHSLAFFPIWRLYKYIKEHGVTVTLDGQGPDEMLAGYRPLQEALWAAIELRKPWWFYDVYRTYAAQGEASHFSSKKYAKDTCSHILKNEHRGIIKHYFTGNVYKENYIEGNFNNSLDNSLYNQFFISPLPGILNQYDRCSMAHGVECRMPFMDYRVVEFIFSLPPRSKVGHGYTKHVLREAMKGILPDDIRLNKLKIGFNAPIIEWLRGDLKAFMLEIMNSPSFINSTYFDGKTIKENYMIFLEQENPQWNVAWQFWPPVHITWWLNKINSYN